MMRPPPHSVFLKLNCLPNFQTSSDPALAIQFRRGSRTDESEAPARLSSTFVDPSTEAHRANHLDHRAAFGGRGVMPGGDRCEAESFDNDAGSAGSVSVMELIPSASAMLASPFDLMRPDRSPRP